MRIRDDAIMQGASERERHLVKSLPGPEVDDAPTVCSPIKSQMLYSYSQGCRRRASDASSSLVHVPACRTLRCSVDAQAREPRPPPCSIGQGRICDQRKRAFTARGGTRRPAPTAGSNVVGRRGVEQSQRSASGARPATWDRLGAACGRAIAATVRQKFGSNRRRRRI